MSHVGFWMGDIGGDSAIEASDVVLMKDDCTGIVNAIKVAKTTSAILNQNIVFVLAVKIIVMILGAFGYANMWMGVFADVGVALIAVLNTMRDFKQIKKERQEIKKLKMISLFYYTFKLYYN